MSSPLATSFRRLKDSIKLGWRALKADPDNPKLERQRQLEAKWEKALKEYAGQRSRMRANS